MTTLTNRRAPSLAVLVVLLACLDVQAQEPAMKQMSLLDGKVSLLMPSQLTPMSTERLIEKYPNANRPSVVYTNPRASVNVALDHTAHRLPVGQLAAAHESVRTTFKNLYPSAEWFRSEMRKINGRAFFLIELRTPAIDTEVRNIIVGTSVDDRLLMISFNVTKALEKEWLPTGNKVIESIAVN
jgi:hypothetical protein